MFSRAELKYLYELRLLNNDNLNRFVGLVCNERDSNNTGKAPFYIISSMVEKASLEVSSYSGVRKGTVYPKKPTPRLPISNGCVSAPMVTRWRTNCCTFDFQVLVAFRVYGTFAHPCPLFDIVTKLILGFYKRSRVWNGGDIQVVFYPRCH